MTKGQVLKGIMQVTVAVLESVPADELGAPSGALYAACSNFGIPLVAYQNIISAFEHQKAVVVSNHLITRGPKYDEVLKRLQDMAGRVK